MPFFLLFVTRNGADPKRPPPPLPANIAPVPVNFMGNSLIGSNDVKPLTIDSHVIALIVLNDSPHIDNSHTLKEIYIFNHYAYNYIYSYLFSIFFV